MHSRVRRCFKPPTTGLHQQGTRKHHDDHVYFRTSADGTIATSYLDHAASQIDHVAKDAPGGWTILLNGPATRVTNSALLAILWR